MHFSQQNAESTDFESGSFDLVISHIMLHETSKSALVRIMKECRRLLRPGGVIVVHRAALAGRAGDPSANDPEVASVREAARIIADDERFVPVLVPLGDGILAATRD